MNRRELIALVGGAMVLVSLAARAQQPRKVPKVGFLYPGSLEVARSRIEATLDGLRAAGYRESEHFQMIARVADNDGSKLPVLAASLAEERVGGKGSASGHKNKSHCCSRSRNRSGRDRS